MIQNIELSQEIKKKEKRKLRDSARKEANLCVKCGKNPLHTKTYCIDCNIKHNNSNRKSNEILVKERDAAGLCRKCGRNPKRNLNKISSQCKFCCLKDIAKSLGGVKKLDELKLLWIEQKGICAETGLRLIIGETASIDHIIAISKGGTHDIKNLRWVHTWVNWSKSNLSNDDFHEFIKMVAIRNELLPDTESCKEIYQMFLKQKAVIEQLTIELTSLRKNKS